MLDLKSKKILVLASNSDDAKMILWCLRESGYSNVIFLGNRSKNQELIYYPLCKKFIPIPENYSYEQRPFEIVELLMSLVVEKSIDIVLPSGFSTIKFLSQFKDQINEFVHIVPVPSLEVINTLGDKLEFAKFCENNNIPHPRTYLLEDINKVQSGQIPVQYPLMTKPLSLSSGKGIMKFENSETLWRYLSETDENKFNSIPLLLQEYTPGPEIDFNGFSTNGHLNAWTIQKSLIIPRKGGSHLRWIQFLQNDEILNIGKSIIEKTKYSGPVHIDMIVDERNGKTVALEINPRFWATTFASNCDGINFVDVAIKSSYDPNFHKKPEYSKRVWGSPHRTIQILLSHHDKNISEYALHHTWLQIKFMILNSFFSLLSYIKMKNKLQK